MTDICGIYVIGTPSGGQYVGSSVRIHKRWNQHRRQLALGVHHCLALQRACDKYGIGALTFLIVEITERVDLLTREQAHIDACERRYNSSPTAGSMLGTVRTPEQRQRQSEALLGIKRSAETRASMSSYAKARSQAHLQKLAESQRGKSATQVTRAKQRAAKLGVKQSAAHIARVIEAQRGQIRADNKSGYRGVSKDGARWVARLRTANGYTNLGRFATPEAANAALTKARVWLDDSQIDELHLSRANPIDKGSVDILIQEY